MEKGKRVQSKHAFISMLGGFSITVDGNVLSDEMNRSLKIWNVLAYLIMNRDRVVPQSELIEHFWPYEHSSSPISALKTLVYRIRSMLEPLFGAEFQPILPKRGGYIWNPAIVMTVDLDTFESLCAKASEPDLSSEKQIDLLKQAIDLYKADFLPKLAGSLWAVLFSARYHALYLESVSRCAVLLEEAGRFEEMADIGLAATKIDLLDEALHTVVVRAFLHQGENAAALAYYEQAVDLLYQNLGVRPSNELRALYDKIMSVEKELEVDLSVIQSDLKETAKNSGPFLCEYGFFREMYRLEARRCLRNGTCLHIALLTVSLPNGNVPSLKMLNTAMGQILHVLLACLRQGDVVAKYSGAQYVIMLPSANLEDSTMVMDRITSSFHRLHRNSFLKLVTKIRAIEFD